MTILKREELVRIELYIKGLPDLSYPIINVISKTFCITEPSAN